MRAPAGSLQPAAPLHPLVGHPGQRGHGAHRVVAAQHDRHVQLGRQHADPACSRLQRRSSGAEPPGGCGHRRRGGSGAVALGALCARRTCCLTSWCCRCTALAAPSTSRLGTSFRLLPAAASVCTSACSPPAAPPQLLPVVWMLPPAAGASRPCSLKRRSNTAKLTATVYALPAALIQAPLLLTAGMSRVPAVCADTLTRTSVHAGAEH
jgi:hypothetical protein